MKREWFKNLVLGLLVVGTLGLGAGGTVVGQGDFTGAVFNDGTGVTCGPDGGCIY